MNQDYCYIRRECFEWILKPKSTNLTKKRFKAVTKYALDGTEPDIHIPKRILMGIDEDKKKVEIERRQETRKTPEYRAWRIAVFERDGYTCQICGQVGGRLNAHHIKSFVDCPEYRIDIDNGVTLCEWCHKYVHRRMRNGEEQFCFIH